MSSSRGLRALLLALGITGMVIGVGFLAATFLVGNPKFKLFGIIYMMVGVILIALRAIIHEMRRAKRSRHHREGRDAGYSS